MQPPAQEQESQRSVAGHAAIRRGTHRRAAGIHGLTLLIALMLLAPIFIVLLRAITDPSIKLLPGLGSRWAVWRDAQSGLPWTDQPPRLRSFECSFHSDELTGPPLMRLRAAESAHVTLNGRALVPIAPASNWKHVIEFDLSAALHDGDNHLAITVESPAGLPALWVSAPNALQTVGRWNARAPGDEIPSPAMSVSQHPPSRGPMQERSWWPIARWLVVAWLAAWAAVAAWTAYRELPASAAPHPPRPLRALPSPLAARSLAWIILTCAVALALHNAWACESWRGPDGRGHVEHVQQVARTWRPALATDGWQAYHPPAYYFASAAVYQALGGQANHEMAIKGAQFLSALSAIALGFMAWWLLRRTFPDHPGAQAAGLVVAVLSPGVVSIAPLVNNTPFATALTVAPLLLWMRFVESDRGLTPGRAFIVGLAVGLALLGRFSAVILLAALLTAMTLEALRDRRLDPIKSALCIALGAALVSAWFYARNIHHFGSPFYANWDAFPGLFRPYVRWWEYYLTAGTFPFSHPDAAAWTSWWDGLYVSFWIGERHTFFASWMSVTFFLLSLLLLAAAPVSIAILLGVGRTLALALQPARPGWIVHAAWALLTVWSITALTWFSMTLPAWGTVTARYVMYLVPLTAVWLAQGRAMLDRRSRWARRLLDGCLLLIALQVLLLYRFGRFRA